MCVAVASFTLGSSDWHQSHSEIHQLQLQRFSHNWQLIVEFLFYIIKADISEITFSEIVRIWSYHLLISFPPRNDFCPIHVSVWRMHRNFVVANDCFFCGCSHPFLYQVFSFVWNFISSSFNSQIITDSLLPHCSHFRFTWPLQLAVQY